MQSPTEARHCAHLSKSFESSENLTLRLLGPMSLAGRVILLIVAIVIICFGSALYFNANLGVSTYDAVSLVVSERQKKVPFRWCRVISDTVCVLIAAVLLRSAGLSWAQSTASIGVATIITAFFMGPLISVFSKMLPNPTGRIY